MSNATQFSTPMTWGVGSNTTSAFSPRISGFGTPKTHWKSAVILGDPPADDPYIINGVDPKKAAEIAFLQKQWSISAAISCSVNFKFGVGTGSVDLTGSATAVGKAIRFLSNASSSASHSANIYSTNKNFQEIFTQLDVFDFNDLDDNASNSESWGSPYSIGLIRGFAFSSNIVSGTLSCTDADAQKSGSIAYQTDSLALDNRFDPPNELASSLRLLISLDKIYFKTDGTCAIRIAFGHSLNLFASSQRVFYPSFSATSLPGISGATLIPNTNFTASILGVPNIPVYIWFNGDPSDVNSIDFTLSYDITPVETWTY